MNLDIADRMRRTVVWILTAWCGLILAAPGTAHALPEVTDLSVSDAVEDQLALDQVFLTDLIDVRTDEGIVTLSGTVNNLMAKERAARIAEKVKGVRAVVNTIDVIPPVLRSDEDIREDVVQALRADPATDAYEISVAVANNEVTLSGTVDSWQERILCGKVAKGVRGVTGLRNAIEVVHKSRRSDDEIQQDVEQALRWDVLVDNALIDVDVNDGQVRLSGTVGSLAEKGRATADAYVANVRGVTAENLDVDFWTRNDQLKGDKYKDFTDSDIQDALQDALFYDPRVASFKVTAEVTDGMATLRGTVDNLKAKRAAARTARNTVGVLGVANRIKVRSEPLPAATVLEDGIEQSYERDPLVDASAITVDVKNGVADLSGTVETAFERTWAADLAERVKGVVAVRNHILVRGYLDPYYFDPYLDDGYTGADTDRYTPSVTLESDRDIQAGIENEFYWSPFVDGEDIDVSVDNGSATLTGEVDSWKEYRAAVENAFEGGAVAVHNKLTVR